MWFLTIIQLFNATANQNDVINNLRIGVGGMPVGIMESLISLALIYAIIVGGNVSKQFPNRRVNPGLIYIEIMLGISFLIGSLSAVMNFVDLTFFLKYARELGAWPIFIFAGYRLLASPKSARYFGVLAMFCGALTAGILLTHFGAQSEDITDSGSFNAVRTVWYISSYAGQAAMLLAYSMVTGDKILPTVIALPLSCLCMAGQFAPLHRVEWLGMFACMAGFITLIPQGKRVSTGIKGLAMVSVLSVALLSSIPLVSKITHRDFGEYVQTRLVSMLPIARQTSKENKAWDTRVDSLREELILWSYNPLMGRGMGIQEALVVRGAIPNFMAFHHNGWAAILAQEGVIGLIAYLSILVAMFLNGRKLALKGKFIGFRFIGVLNFMGSLFGVAETMGSMMWTARLAMFYGILLGMSFRCLDMMVESPEEEAYVPEELEHPLEPQPEYAHSDF